MIKDKLINSDIYAKISQNLKKGFDWLNNTNLEDIEDRKYYIDAENVYANVQTYETKEDALYESHREYIDIQYMIKGEEKVGVTDIQNCNSTVAYDMEKDLEFFEYTGREEYLTLSSGEFLVLFPQDAHKPSISISKKSIVKKVVVKVRIG